MICLQAICGYWARSSSDTRVAASPTISRRRTTSRMARCSLDRQSRIGYSVKINHTRDHDRRVLPRVEESDMQRSTHRILTTHVGSLARPDALIPLLRLKERGQPYDTEAFARLVREAVADVVRKQVEAGIDIVTDGEQGKESFFGYINDRFNGFELQPVPPEQVCNPRAAGREYAV